MKNRDDGLVPPGALPSENRIEAFASRAKAPEGIGADGGRPVDSRDDPASILALRAIAEGRLGKIGKTSMLKFGLAIIECFRRNAEAREFRGEMILADHPQVLRFDGAA